MKIQTLRFGEIEVQPAQVFEMVRPLIGFPDTSFALISDEGTAPVQWLQSLTTPHLCLPLADPLAIMPGFDIEIPREECSMLELERAPTEQETGEQVTGDNPNHSTAQLFHPSTVLIRAIVVLDPEPRNIRVNLKAPVVFNVVNQKAIQIVADNPDLPVKYYIFAQNPEQEGFRLQATGHRKKDRIRT